ncbi:tetratricopeptide repeat protein [Idiomarina sp.]|uniref:tetratricopeptide repeat protein n=1 Tax=Idiomarina sp. TaxID=1874361 RepID=UPI003A92B7D0
MSFIKKLFGRKKGKNKGVKPNSSEPGEVKSKDDMIKAYDDYGREIYISKSSWLNSVLVGNLEKNRDNPDELYNLIVSALNDGFEAHIQDASARLYGIDPVKERGACIYAIVLMKNNDLDQAEKILKETMASIGESGVLLTNLAKVYAKRNDHRMAEKILWSALEADPNQDNGLEWYAAIHNERGGKSSYIDALTRVSRLSGAWRPQLWLAREALDSGEKNVAISLYEEIFRLSDSPDSQVLQQISGDLGLKGHIEEIITVVTPHFDIEQHGFSVGNNLIKAFIELKRFQEAKSLVEALFAQKRPDWKEGLSYWENELDNLMGGYGPLEDSTPPKLALMSVEKPIWLHKLNSVDDVLPPKNEKPFTILTTSGSCSVNEKHDQLIKQKTNQEGSLCRGIPLSICDKLNLETSGQAVMLVPVVENAGFAFFGERYEEHWVTQLAERTPCDLIILPHLYAESNQWKMEFRIFDSTGSSLIKTIAIGFSPDQPSLALKELVDEVCLYITENYSIKLASSPVRVSQVTPKLFAHYVDANDSCLALSLACNVDDGPSTLYGERNIFDKLLKLALEEPNSDIRKLMLVSAMAKNKAYHSRIYLEYEKKLKKLLEEQTSGSAISIALTKAVDDIYEHRSVV